MDTSKIRAMKQPQIGELIHEVRREIRLTQEEFAASLGVTFNTVNRWENRRSRPSPMALRAIELKLLELGESGNELLEKYCNFKSD